MTYAQLLKKTQNRKVMALRIVNRSLKGTLGFLAKAEIDRNPTAIAWHYLAEGFCKDLAEHRSEILDTLETDEAIEKEIIAICTAYRNNDPNIHDLLPIEARLFSPLDAQSDPWNQGSIIEPL